MNETKPNTHLGIDANLVGRVETLSPGRASVVLETTDAMSADDHGLVHGGFVFGAADYAAMLAVNDPNVVLGAAETRFSAPVRVGQRVTLDAEITGEKGKKRSVDVVGRVREGGEATEVFTGTFTCFVLPKHVLEND